MNVKQEEENMAPSRRDDRGSAPTIFGRPIVHVGYAVQSIEDAVTFFSGVMGAGPFFLMENINIPVLRNERGPITLEHSAAFGRWGNVGVELQQVHRLEPADALGSAYQRRDGVNHVAYVVDDLDDERARLDGFGLKLLFEAVNGPHESVLYDAPALGHTIEVHRDFPMFQEFQKLQVDAARGWDGSDPLRPVPRSVQKTIVD